MTGQNATAEKVATQLLRLSLDPQRGRLIGGHRLAISLRAAIFVELILAGRIVSIKGCPTATATATGTGPSDRPDRILDGLEAAVIRRPRVVWWRWFRHVDVDLEAILGELSAAGRWVSLGKGTWADQEREQTARLHAHVLAVRQFGLAPASAAEGALAYLLELTAVSKPRDLPPLWAPVLMPLVADRPARHALSECLTLVAGVRQGRLTGALRH